MSPSAPRSGRSKPFHSPRADLPKVLRQDNLDYDKYRQIRFRRDQALWRADNLPFRIEFFHPGYLYQEPVHVNEFTATHVQPIRFVQDFFDYGGLHIQNEIPANTGYAGFRVLYQLNETNQWDELGAFLGASYFRLLGKDQVTASRRAGWRWIAAKRTGRRNFPSSPTGGWASRKPDDKELTLYAMLDSVSCTGAYRISHPSRRDDRGGRRGGAVFPRAEGHSGGEPATAAARQDHRPGAADQHVLVSARIRNASLTITARKSMTATAC